FLVVVPQPQVGMGDAAVGLHRGGLQDQQACAGQGQVAKMDAVPVGDHALVRRVLAHGRDDDAVGQLQGTEVERREQLAHGGWVRTGPALQRRHGTASRPWLDRSIALDVTPSPLPASPGSTCTQSASSLSMARSSARVRPRLRIATGIPASAAIRAKRKPDQTISDEPTTSIASLACRAAVASSTRTRGTLSPKNTTSGLSMPPQAGQSGTSKPAKSTPSRSASPSGATVARWASQPGLRSS